MAKILLIEDDMLVAETIRHTLMKVGHDVIHAPNGREGMELAVRTSPDLVITDMFMPEVDGMDVVRNLRAMSQTLPIVAISGGGRQGDLTFLQIAEKLGASALIRKPFKNSVLISTVAACIAPLAA